MWRWSAAVSVTAIVLGCGPSLRRVQQSRVYFERCYAADFDPRIPVAEKHACWNAWMEHYTLGQPRDRRDYAEERIYAIEHGESVPRLPGLPEAALGPTRAVTVTAASGPTTDPVERAAAPRTADEEELPERPRRGHDYTPPVPQTNNPTCATSACESGWQSCLDSCPEHGDDACQTACEVELQACARGCF